MVPTGIILNIYQTLTIWPNSPQTTNLQDKCSYDDYLRSKETGIETGSLPELMKSYVAAGFSLLGFRFSHLTQLGWGFHSVVAVGHNVTPVRPLTRPQAVMVLSTNQWERKTAHVRKWLGNIYYWILSWIEAKSLKSVHLLQQAYK